MSRQVSAEGLAWIELVLLGMALLAWLRHRQDGRRAFRFVLAWGSSSAPPVFPGWRTATG